MLNIQNTRFSESEHEMAKEYIDRQYINVINYIVWVLNAPLSLLVSPKKNENVQFFSTHSRYYYKLRRKGE